jgi:uncharacterized protein (DUF305 family)
MFIRQQTAISDQQFLRSMIPHHAGAILMCEQAQIIDPQIEKLCGAIISSQQAEIQQMIGATPPGPVGTCADPRLFSADIFAEFC